MEVKSDATPSRSAVGFLCRALWTLLAWVLLGIPVGISTAPQHQGSIPIIAGAVAGMIVLAVVGLCCGLLGGRCLPTILGAAAGAVVTTIAAWISPAAAHVPSLAGIGLVAGGLVGSTASAFLQMWAWVLSRLVPSSAR